MAVSDLNSVVLIGRLTRDAELTYAKSGTPICSISIAVNSSRKENDQWISEANFFDVSYFGKPAEAVKQYLTKGKQIAVQGSLRQDVWEKDGQKHSKVRVIASNIELLGGRSDGGPSSYSGNSYGNSSYGSASSGGFQARPSYNSSASVSQGGAAAYDSPSDGDSFGGGNSGFPEDIPF